ncbi:hypothetical protein B0O99DRAFT_682520 [Bisporella sp. PMI_857]|nr:hypothetical protein B0O99DRAFT_682520 [Bisporella sp. PMI_857]
MSQGYFSYPRPRSPSSSRDVDDNALSWNWLPRNGAGAASNNNNPLSIDEPGSIDDSLFGDNDIFGDYEYDSFSLFNSPTPQPFLSGPEVSSSQQPPSNQQARNLSRLSQRSGQRRSEYNQYDFSDSPDPYADFLDLSPPRNTSSRDTGSRRITRQSSVVDLTESPPPEMAPQTRKRRANTPAEVRASKSARTGTKASASASKIKPEDGAEVIDLADVEDEAQLKVFQAKQAADLIKQQQQEEANKPIRLAEFQCVICMDNPTDLTVTHCGHLFCSECLHQALHADNGKRSCPVCRTHVSTAPAPGKKQSKTGFFHLEMKLMTANKKGKQPVRDK